MTTPMQLSLLDAIPTETPAPTVELRRLVSTVNGISRLETRARCQDDGHPAGCWSPWLGVTVCHCGRVWHRGRLPIVAWPRPVTKPKVRPVFR